jgi:hypothetical protein
MDAAADGGSSSMELRGLQKVTADSAAAGDAAGN